eukprot:TRINITY_DN1074_c0_g2_i1.p1 TRINITY_DN1074_c0_g2~~TRINITY_DN1074_c0_g2_i1.p1  ORF type:complete len:386 (+),score=103.58 TRINITY_DN1074_c0_g2_i1:20-1177(+)
MSSHQALSPAGSLAPHHAAAVAGGTQVSAQKVTIVGSGNWGSAIAPIIGNNVLNSDDFDNEVRMWVFDEEFEGRMLSQIINETHENPKYLKGCALPHNIVAVPDLQEACRGANILVFAVPHQFLRGLLGEIYQVKAKSCRAISLIKGVEFDESGSPLLISDIIRAALGVDCSVLMGANVASEVAKGEFCEATVGARIPRNGKLFHELFNTSSFRINTVADLPGVEMCGAIKNVVALAAGFTDGLGLGGNTKAAIMRIGLSEMERFCRKFFNGVQSSTFFESCGIADLITTCYGGRNRKCAEAFAKEDGRRSWDDIEKELLNGQKLQGTITAMDIMVALRGLQCEAEFPLFTLTYQIAFEGVPVKDLVDKLPMAKIHGHGGHGAKL